MEDAWQLVMALCWEAYRVGSLPIGAVVVDVEGRVVSSARSRRHEDVPVIGQLSGTRIAHAEVNALAQLPVSGRYGEHTVCVNVEPCCLCMGAVWQTGIGSVRYGWRDRYGGAASCMTVANPQVLCRPLSVHGPAGGLVEALTGLLLACHYRYLRPASTTSPGRGSRRSRTSSPPPRTPGWRRSSAERLPPASASRASSPPSSR